MMLSTVSPMWYPMVAWPIALYMAAVTVLFVVRFRPLVERGVALLGMRLLALGILAAALRIVWRVRPGAPPPPFLNGLDAALALLPWLLVGAGVTALLIVGAVGNVEPRAVPGIAWRKLKGSTRRRPRV